MNRIDAILESIVDPTREDLDLNVFNKKDGEYILKKYHKIQLQNIVEEVDESIIPVNNWFIKGSILSRQWLDWSDIDILIEVDDIPDEKWDALMDEIKEKYEDVKLGGTDHHIEIFLQRGKYDKDRTEGIYDVVNDKWIKGPYDTKIDISKYIDDFEREAQSLDLEIGGLRRSVRDFEILNSLSDDEVSAMSDKIKEKMIKVDKDARRIVRHLKHIKMDRRKAFDTSMDSEEIKIYGDKNKLPENVIAKLIERHKYFDLYDAIKRIRKLDNNPKKIDSNREVKELDSELGMSFKPV